MPRGRRRTGGVRWADLRGDRRGASSVQYIVVAGAIALAVVGAWRLFGQSLAGMVTREGHDVATLTPECLYCDRSHTAGEGTATALPAAAETAANGGRASPSSSGPSGGPPPAARPSAPPWIGGVLKIMCPKDKAFLRQLKNNGVQITAYDRIYFDDPYYDGHTWTTKRFEAGGTTENKKINMIRSPNAADNAATIYHEGVHTGQPRGMAWREKEYEAYTKEEAWAISHGLPAHDPSFRAVDASGRPIPNTAAIHAFVDKEYPGVTSTPSAGGPPEQIVGEDASGQTIVERPDGTRYTRPPKAGDSYPADDAVREPPGGLPVDMSTLQCP